jgi:hypothetical protein
MVDDREVLRTRISELQAQVATLRVGRRILLNMVAKLQEDRKTETSRLEKQMRALETRNKRLCRNLHDQTGAGSAKLCLLRTLTADKTTK